MLSITPSELTVSDNANAVYGGCYTTKSVYDGTCREEVGCGGAGCLPLDEGNPDTAYVCNSSIPTEGSPDTPKNGYALLKNANGWNNSCDTPEQGNMTCSTSQIACAVEVQCYSTCAYVPVGATVYPNPPSMEWRCVNDGQQTDYLPRGQKTHYTASGVACPAQ
jgi:hypothetical protein